MIHQLDRYQPSAMVIQSWDDHFVPKYRNTRISKVPSFRGCQQQRIDGWKLLPGIVM
jgi:hypothetical protein